MLPLAQFVAREAARYPVNGSTRQAAEPREAHSGPGVAARLFAWARSPRASGRPAPRRV